MSADYEYGYRTGKRHGYDEGYRAARERADLELAQLRAQVELLVKHAACLDYLKPRVVALEKK
jgi:flagellar biosynthesis/type III secretory pathway protein FliH